MLSSRLEEFCHFGSSSSVEWRVSDSSGGSAATRVAYQETLPFSISFEAIADPA